MYNSDLLFSEMINGLTIHVFEFIFIKKSSHSRDYIFFCHQMNGHPSYLRKILSNGAAFGSLRQIGLGKNSTNQLKFCSASHSDLGSSSSRQAS